MRFVRAANNRVAIIPKKSPKVSKGEGRTYVTALARGLSVMTAFDEQHAALTLSDVARSGAVGHLTNRHIGKTT